MSGVWHRGQPPLPRHLEALLPNVHGAPVMIEGHE